MSVNSKTAKKIGLLSAVSILVSSIIGIGIFFKNGSVFKENMNNPYGVLLSWILASIISFVTAYSFSEVGFNHQHGSGLAGSIERMFGYKFSRFIAINNSFFYWNILSLVLGFFSAEALVKLCYAGGEISPQFHIAYVMLITLGMFFLSSTFNYISIKWASRYQVFATILKFVPLLVIGTVGVVYGLLHSDVNLFSNSFVNTEEVTKGSFSITGVLSSIPSILFAYDSFLGVGSLKHELKNPKRNVPLTVLIGMLLVIFLYLFITVGQIMVGTGVAQNTFEVIFKNNQKIKDICTIIISLVIFLSVLGTFNAIVFVTLRVTTFSINYRIMFGYWRFSKYNEDGNKSGYFYSLIIMFLWWLILFIPTAIINNDTIVDGVSNFPTLFMFAIYGLVIFKAWINRFTKKVHTDKIPGFIIIAPIATLGCFLAFGYQFFYRFSTQIIIDIINNNVKNYSWGLFLDHGGIKETYAGIVFFVMLIVFIVGPFINDALIKIKYKRNNCGKLLLRELLV